MQVAQDSWRSSGAAASEPLGPAKWSMHPNLHEDFSGFGRQFSVREDFDAADSAEPGAAGSAAARERDDSSDSDADFLSAEDDETLDEAFQREWDAGDSDGDGRGGAGVAGGRTASPLRTAEPSFEGVFIPPTPTRRTTLDVGSPDVGRVLAEGYGVAEAEAARAAPAGSSAEAADVGDRAVRDSAGAAGDPRAAGAPGRGPARDAAEETPESRRKFLRELRELEDAEDAEEATAADLPAPSPKLRVGDSFLRAETRSVSAAAENGGVGAAARRRAELAAYERQRAEALRDRGRIGDRAGETDSLCRCTMC
jgi:hypothetical protein